MIVLGILYTDSGCHFFVIFIMKNVANLAINVATTLCYFVMVEVQWLVSKKIKSIDYIAKKIVYKR
jgi:hypothetical protein